jgi:hypothetical protein
VTRVTKRVAVHIGTGVHELAETPKMLSNEERQGGEAVAEPE